MDDTHVRKACLATELGRGIEGTLVELAGKQDEATLKQIYADLLVLEKEGPSLGRPLVDRVKGSKLHHLKELRVTSCGGQVIRILFAFDPKRQAVLLLAGDKSRAGSSRAKWNGWYAINIPKAEQIYRRHVRRLDRDGTA